MWTSQQRRLPEVRDLDAQLPQIAVISRCQYQQTATVIVQIFDPVATEYEAVLSAGAPLDEAGKVSSASCTACSCRPSLARKDDDNSDAGVEANCLAPPPQTKRHTAFRNQC